MEMGLVALLAAPVGLSLVGTGIFFARRRQASWSALEDDDAPGALDDDASPPLPPPLPDDPEDAFFGAAVDEDPPDADLPGPHDRAANDDAEPQAGGGDADARDVALLTFVADDDADQLQAAAEDFAAALAPALDGDDETLTLAAAVKRSEELAPMPEVVRELLSVAGRDDVGAPALAAIVERDQSVAGMFFRLANSAFFGCREEAADIHAAVARVGNANVRQLVVGLAMAQAAQNGPASARGLCDRMLGEAACGRTLAQHVDALDGPSVFLTCMVRDMGQVLLLLQLGERYETFCAGAHAAGLPLHIAEAAWLGFTHADVGASLAANWGLADPVRHAIRVHHDRAAADEAGPEVAGLVTAAHVAGVLAHACRDVVDEARDLRAQRAAREQLGVPARAAKILVEEGVAAIFQMSTVFE